MAVAAVPDTRPREQTHCLEPETVPERMAAPAQQQPILVRAEAADVAARASPERHQPVLVVRVGLVAPHLFLDQQSPMQVVVVGAQSQPLGPAALVAAAAAA